MDKVAQDKRNCSRDMDESSRPAKKRRFKAYEGSLVPRCGSRDEGQVLTESTSLSRPECRNGYFRQANTSNSFSGFPTNSRDVPNAFESATEAASAVAKRMDKPGSVERRHLTEPTRPSSRVGAAEIKATCHMEGSLWPSTSLDSLRQVDCSPKMNQLLMGSKQVATAPDHACLPDPPKASHVYRESDFVGNHQSPSQFLHGHCTTVDDDDQSVKFRSGRDSGCHEQSEIHRHFFQQPCCSPTKDDEGEHLFSDGNTERTGITTNTANGNHHSSAPHPRILQSYEQQPLKAATRPGELRLLHATQALASSINGGGSAQPDYPMGGTGPTSSHSATTARSTTFGESPLLSSLHGTTGEAPSDYPTYSTSYDYNSLRRAVDCLRGIPSHASLAGQGVTLLQGAQVSRLGEPQVAHRREREPHRTTLVSDYQHRTEMSSTFSNGRRLCADHSLGRGHEMELSNHTSSAVSTLPSLLLALERPSMIGGSQSLDQSRMLDSTTTSRPLLASGPSQLLCPSSLQAMSAEAQAVAEMQWRRRQNVNPTVAVIAREDSRKHSGDPTEASSPSRAYPLTLPPCEEGPLPPYSKRVILPLSTDKDRDHLSELLCYVRSELVEVFRASGEDVAARIHNKRIVYQQVGVRCKFCAHLPREERHRRAATFPSETNRIQPSVAMMMREHFDDCKAMPQRIKSKYHKLRAVQSYSGADSRKFWKEAAMQMGLVDTPEGIAFVQAHVLPRKQPKSTSGQPEPLPCQGRRELLTETNDRALIQDFYYFLMSQAHRISLTEVDQKQDCGSRTKHLMPLNTQGFGCRYCCDTTSGKCETNRFFPQKRRFLQSNALQFHQHLQYCPKCPTEVKVCLALLKSESEKALSSSDEEKEKVKAFFARIWARMHGHIPAGQNIPAECHEQRKRCLGLNE